MRKVLGPWWRKFSQQTVAKCSDAVNTKIDYDHELRFSRIPEYKEAQNESTEKVNLSKVFEHDQKLIQSAFENLGLNSIEISFSATRKIRTWEN